MNYLDYICMVLMPVIPDLYALFGLVYDVK